MQTHVYKHALTLHILFVRVSVHTWLLNLLPEGSNTPLVRLLQVFEKESACMSQGVRIRTAHLFHLSIEGEHVEVCRRRAPQQENATLKIELCVMLVTPDGAKKKVNKKCFVLTS